jgi:hypothetical protein
LIEANHPLQIDGSITGHKRQQAIDRFQARSVDGKEEPFIMLLSTRAGGKLMNPSNFIVAGESVSDRATFQAWG